jgi:uncharacterized protein (TIGR00255 family)
MTGFGKVGLANNLFEVNVEIKSVNHRFKDFRFRMSNQLNELELELKKYLEKAFFRGSFDISIYFKKVRTEDSVYDFDRDAIERMLRSFNDSLGENAIFTQPFSIQLNPIDFLKSEFMQDQDDEQKANLHELVKKAMESCCAQLAESREKEGEKLIQTLLNHLGKYHETIELVKEKKKDFNQLISEKLQTKLNDQFKDIQVDDQRFAQEVVYYLERLDVDEEIDRAIVHINRLKQILLQKAPKAKGREIEFVLQELHRETNTLGSKSADPVLSNYVVEMKLQLEKMREQALNIE